MGEPKWRFWKRAAFIALYAAVGISFAASFYPDRCKPEDSWGDVFFMVQTATVWPLFAAVRIGTAIHDPVEALEPFGCPSPPEEQ